MSHFAKVVDGIVAQVIVAESDFIESGAVGDPSDWVQTSYNNNFRKCFAGIGFHYDQVNDVFFPPKPYESWSLNEAFDWVAPIAKPDDGNFYEWDENSQSWIEIN